LWEVERGMPVRRNPGGVGRVYAYTSELTAWREGTLNETSVTEPPPTAPERRNLRWAYWAVPTVLLAAAFLVWFPNRSRGIPSAWRLDGQLLTVTGSEGTTIWSCRFSEVPLRNWEGDSSFSSPGFFDIDGDGLQEMLFPFNSGTNASPGVGSLLCFSSTGDIRWNFQMDKTVFGADGRRYPPPYGIRAFAQVPSVGNAPPRLVVTFYHITEFPSAAVLLDANGSPLRSYWHSGHICPILVTDLVPGGGPEIYLGAISNSLHRSTLIALDPESFNGADREEDPKYQIAGMAPPRELARIVFNRLRIGPSLSAFGLVGSLRRHGDTLVVGINEDPDRTIGAAQMATFLPRLVLQDVTIASSTYAAYRRFHG